MFLRSHCNICKEHMVRLIFIITFKTSEKMVLLIFIITFKTSEKMVLLNHSELAYIFIYHYCNLLIYTSAIIVGWPLVFSLPTASFWTVTSWSWFWGILYGNSLRRFNSNTYLHTHTHQRTVKRMPPTPNYNACKI